MSCQHPDHFVCGECGCFRPIDPKVSNGHRFIFAAIGHFTKWIEATSYFNITKGVVLIKFVKKELICRYGLSDGIIMDHAKNLNNKMMDAIQDQSHKFDSIPP